MGVPPDVDACVGLVVKEPSMEQHLLQVRAHPLIRDGVEILPPHQSRMALRDGQLRLMPCGIAMAADLETWHCRADGRHK